MSGHRWLALGLAGAVVACGREEVPPAPPVPVTVAVVGGGAGAGETRYGGAIKADASVDVAFRMSGIVDRVTQVRGADGRMRTIQDGDPVRKGDVLARLGQDG